ncbi:MAG: hemerythrin domain-containing protein [Polyangiaceae bacterium]|jgi:hemerythrin-like domain-containing protein
MPDDRPRQRRHPLDRLARSHERLREQLAALSELGRAAEIDLEGLADIAAWFSGPSARHEADEEESLFPRLRGAAIDDELRVLLERLAEQHHVHARLEAELASARTVAEVASVAAKMDEAYRAHMDLEEQRLFPTARAILTESDFEAISTEMEARRGRDASKP